MASFIITYFRDPKGPRRYPTPSTLSGISNLPLVYLSRPARRTPPEGTTIFDDFVAGDTSVSISAYVVHRNESVFIDPEVSRPGRWLGDAGKKLQQSFVAFSTGARGCIGRNISYLEQTVLLASLVHRCRFDRPSPDWKPVRRDTTNLSLGSMHLKVWRCGETICHNVA